MKMKMWMIVTVDTEVEWPSKETSVQFAGHTLILRPPEGDSAADVRLQYDHPQSERAAYETISRFLSTLSWWRHRPIKADLRFSCTAPMRGCNRRLGPPLQSDYRLSPAVALASDAKARLALSLYREAGNVHGTPYEFL